MCRKAVFNKAIELNKHLGLVSTLGRRDTPRRRALTGSRPMRT